MPRIRMMLCHHTCFPTCRRTPFVCLEDAVLGELQPLLPGPPAGAETESPPLRGHNSPSTTEPHHVPSLTNECGSGPASPWGKLCHWRWLLPHPGRGGVACLLPPPADARCRPSQLQCLLGLSPPPPAIRPPGGVCSLLTSSPRSLSCQIRAPLVSCGGPSLATDVPGHQPNRRLRTHCSHQRGTLNPPSCSTSPGRTLQEPLPTCTAVPRCRYNHPRHAAPTSCPGAACWELGCCERSRRQL